MRPLRANCEDGFTLIEMIVSLAILSIALGVLFAAFSSDMDRQRLSRDEMRARLLAQALLAENMSPGAGVHAGASPEGFSWRVVVTPFGDDADTKAWAFAPARVTAQVSWPRDGQMHTLTLSTLRPMEKQP